MKVSRVLLELFRLAVIATIGGATAIIVAYFLFSEGETNVVWALKFEVVDSETGQPLSCAILHLNEGVLTPDGEFHFFEGERFEADSNGLVEVRVGVGVYAPQVSCKTGGYPILVDFTQIQMISNGTFTVTDSNYYEVLDDVIRVKLTPGQPPPRS